MSVRTLGSSMLKQLLRHKFALVWAGGAFQKCTYPVLILFVCLVKDFSRIFIHASGGERGWSAVYNFTCPTPLYKAGVWRVLRVADALVYSTHLICTSVILLLLLLLLSVVTNFRDHCL